MEGKDCYVTCKKLQNVTEQRNEFRRKYEMSCKAERFGCECGMLLGAIASFIGIMIARVSQ